jgi:hypothetical protein
MVFMVNCTAPGVRIREIRALIAEKLWITISTVGNIGIHELQPQANASLKVCGTLRTLF